MIHRKYKDLSLDKTNREIELSKINNLNKLLSLDPKIYWTQLIIFVGKTKMQSIFNEEEKHQEEEFIRQGVVPSEEILM